MRIDRTILKKKLFQKAVTVFVLGVTGIIGYFFVLSPTCSSLSATNSQLREQDLLKSQYQQAQSDAQSKSIQIKNMLVQQKQQEDCFFSSEQADEFVHHFRQQLTAQQCTSESIELSDSALLPIGRQSQPSGRFGFWKVQVQASGSYENWIKILDWVEKYKREVLVNSLQLQTSKTNSSVLNVSMEIVLPVMDDLSGT